MPAFWAGGRAWKVRYASPDARHAPLAEQVLRAGRRRPARTARGRWPSGRTTARTRCSCTVPPRVAADRRHFAHADGTPLFWLADTWWMGLCRRLHWPDEFQPLAADRKAKGFNVIQIVAGLYPDMPAFDPRGANEAGLPWEKDYAGIRPEYFDRADQRLLYLVDQGFMPCIVGAWGYHLPWLGVGAHEGALAVPDRPLCRSAGRVVCRGRRHDAVLSRKGSSQAGQQAAWQKQGWSEVLRFIRGTDPFGRMITIHPSRSARETVTEPALLDFDMHQTGHQPETAIGRMARQMQTAYDLQPVMPVIAGESSYDGLDRREWGGETLSSDAARQMFWVGLMHNGAAGGTYGANGIWQVNRREAPYGPSPHGRSWGSIPWDQAMERPGSAQAGFARQFFARYPWHRLEPRPVRPRGPMRSRPTTTSGPGRSRRARICSSCTSRVRVPSW